MSKIKVSCESCGLIAKVDAGEELLPCHKCGGKRVPFDWDRGAQQDAKPAPPPPPPPSRAAAAPARPRARASRRQGAHVDQGGVRQRQSAASRRAMRDQRQQKQKGMPAWLLILIGFVVVVGLIIAFAFWKVADTIDTALERQEQQIAKAEREAAEWEARKEAFEPVILRFTSAWQRSDRAALAALMPEEKALQEKAFRLLDNSLETYELDPTSALAPISDRRELWSRRDPYNVKSYFGVDRDDGGPNIKLRTNWMWQNGSWRLVELYVRPTSR